MIKRGPIEVENDYTKAPNAWIRDDRMSPDARLFAIEVLSFRVGWQVSMQWLVDNNPVSRTVVRRCIHELEENGYLVRIASGERRGNEIDYLLVNPHGGNSGTKCPTEGGSVGQNVPLSRTKRPTAVGQNVPPNKTSNKTKDKTTSANASVSELRPDVARILDHFDERLNAGGIQPRLQKRNQANVNAVRLLLDRDRAPLDEVLAVMDWATEPKNFWAGVIGCTDKFRKQYPQMVAQMRQARLRDQPEEKPERVWGTGPRDAPLPPADLFSV